jgi:hypothetical protein
MPHGSTLTCHVVLAAESWATRRMNAGGPVSSWVTGEIMLSH